MRTRNLRSVVYLAAGLGLIVAVFAAVEFLDASLRSVCSVSSFFSCALVDQSGLTTTLGIPDYYWGIGGFVGILIVAALAEQRPADRLRAYALVGVTSAGVALSVYLLYVQLALIHALCIVCASDYLLCSVAWFGSIELVRRGADLPENDDDEDPGEADEDA